MIFKKQNIICFFNINLFFSSVFLPKAQADLDDPDILSNILEVQDELENVADDQDSKDKKVMPSKSVRSADRSSPEADVTKSPIEVPATQRALTENSSIVKMDEPIHWVAKDLRANNKKRTIYLKEDVVVTKGAITFAADEAQVFFSDNNEVTEIHAKGNVKFRKDNWKPNEIMNASGDEAVFKNKKHIVVLKGDKNRNAVIGRGPSLEKALNRVEGKEVTYNLIDGDFSAEEVRGAMQKTTERPVKSE